MITIGFGSTSTIRLYKTYAAAALFLLTAFVKLSAQTEQEDIAALQQILAQEGFHALAASGQTAPLIPSQWWIDRLEDGPQKQLEQSRHDFGTQLVSTLDKEVEHLKTLNTSAQREEAVEHLLDFSGWLARPGYGNLFLHARAQSLAAIPLAYLTADLSYPEAEIEAFLGRFRNYNREADVQVEVLNRELGEARFTVTTNKAPLVQEMWLDAIWGDGMIDDVRQWREEQAVDSRLSDLEVRSRMPKKVAFFVDQYLRH